MAKLKSAPITAEKLSQYLQEQDDFALELRVLKAARERTRFAWHGGTYTDDQTGKPRQFDLRVDFELHCGTSARKVRLFIECKCLKSSFPLLVSCVPRHKDECFHDLILPAAATGMSPDVRRCRWPNDNSLYNDKAHVGKSTAQVGETPTGELVSSDSETYDKWAQALASLGAEVKSALKIDAGILRHQTAFLPILVVPDGTLWVVDYQPDGTPSANGPEQKECATIFVDRSFEESGKTFTASHLHVFTEAGIAAFFDTLVRRPDGSFDDWWDIAFPW